MNRNYLDGFVHATGLLGLLYALGTSDLRKAMLAGSVLVLYEAGQFALELYKDM